MAYTERAAIACRLDVADYKDRLAWIAELNAAALRDYRSDGRRIELTYEPPAAARVRELVRREQECCPLLKFTARAETSAVTLTVEAPHEAAEAADTILAPYTSERPTP